MSSFLTRSNLVSPHDHLSIFISAVPIALISAYFIAHVSDPYFMTCFIYFPLSLSCIFRSHITPVKHLDFCNPFEILVSIASSQSPFVANLLLRYLKRRTSFTWRSPSFTPSPSFSAPRNMYSVLPIFTLESSIIKLTFAKGILTFLSVQQPRHQGSPNCVLTQQLIESG